MTEAGLVPFLRRRRGRVFLSLMFLYALGLGMDILFSLRVVPPVSYLYLFMATLAALYGVLPLYTNRRLTAHYWQRTRRRRPALWGLGFILLLAVAALVGPLFTPDPTAVDFSAQNLPPVGFTIEQSTYDLKTEQFQFRLTPGTWAHPLGTDDNGRDMLAMLVSGAGVSLLVGLLATGIAIFLGAVIGVSSAYWGGWVDNVLMRFTDIMMTFPFFLLLVIIVYLYGPSLTLIILAIGLTGWTGTARLVRSEALSLRTRDFILAARSLGASDARIIFAHLIPNTLSSIIVIATLSIPGIIVAESALSFIGLGDPTVASWGRILNSGQ
ncbi:MAG: ABC transporter permease, partial [Dehalococcoidia bacterium]